jgi:hypothetical protein
MGRSNTIAVKWILTLTAEFDCNETKVREVITWDRASALTHPTILFVSIEGGKRIVPNVQAPHGIRSGRPVRRGTDGLPFVRLPNGANSRFSRW